jgi:hypothetical protein
VRRIVSPALYLSLSLCISAFALSSASGQTIGSGGRGQQDIQNREWALSHISQEVNSHFRKDGKVQLPLIRDDFRQLQVVNNDLMKRCFIQKQIDPKQIMSAVGEIKKRAVRLRANLGFTEPASQPAEKTASGDQSASVKLSPTLLQLDDAVMSFVNSPMFRESKVLDSKTFLDSGRELSDVIRISEKVASLANEMKRSK